MNKFVKPRTETFNERITRLHHDYDDGPKPAHYDDKNIITMEKRAELNKKVSGPKSLKKIQVEKTTPNNITEYFTKEANKLKPFKNNDPSTYPSAQKKTLNTWEAMLELAKNPKNRDDRLEAGEMRKTILKNYRDPVMRKHLGDDELKLIGKHRSQLFPKEEPILTATPAVVKPKVPEIPLEEQIRIRANRRHQEKLKGLTDKYGNDGVMRIIKDFI